jgi:hypothetical protein
MSVKYDYYDLQAHFRFNNSGNKGVPVFKADTLAVPREQTHSN